ncbi:MAG: OFA family MFS transporter [Desertifilum sp.]|nr:OFA family MFS transporter [Desertifilum sp.]
MTLLTQPTLFGFPAVRGRWLILPLGILVLLCLGSIYTWTIFVKPLQELLQLSATESLLPFTAVLLFYSIFTTLTGLFLEKIGIRRAAAISGLIVGLGYILSSFANTTPQLVLAYGLVVGIGAGIGYGVPIAVAAKWFPDKKGLAVGTTVIGFGLSPFISAPIARQLITLYGVRPTFIILGVAFSAIILAIAPFLVSPPPGWHPQPSSSTQSTASQSSETNSPPLWRTRRFYGLWVCYAIGVFMGVATIGIASPVAQETIRLDATTAAFSVSIFAIFNGASRPFFGWLTDWVKPKKAAIASYTLSLIASILMIQASPGDVHTYLVAFSLFAFGFGGWLALAPTATLSLFSSQNFARNYGIIFAAYGVGAVAGTLIAGQCRDLFGSYNAFFYPTLVLSIVGILWATFMLKAQPQRRSEPLFAECVQCVSYNPLTQTCQIATSGASDTLECNNFQAL